MGLGLEFGIRDEALGIEFPQEDFETFINGQAAPDPPALALRANITLSNQSSYETNINMPCLLYPVLSFREHKAQSSRVLLGDVLLFFGGGRRGVGILYR